MAEYSGAATIVLNGTALAQCDNAQLSVASNDNAVMTLAQGHAGFSDGAETCDLSFDNAIPVAGLEQNFDRFVRDHETVTFGFRIANTIFELSGRFLTLEITSSTNTPNKAALTFKGKVVSTTNA